MEKKYIQDKDGNPILPITHISAVRDDDGNSLDSVLGAFEDNVESTIDERMDEQDDKIALLNGSEVIVVADHTQVSTPDSQKIYREQGSTSYTDWMYQGGAWKDIATYDFPGIDDEPTAGSSNLVKSGGVNTAIETCFYPKEVPIGGEINQARFDSNNSIIQAAITTFKIKYIKANVSGDYLVVLHGINTEPGSTTKLYGHNVGVFTNEPVIGSESIYFTKRTDLNKGKIIITKVHLEENQYLAVSYNTACGITSFFTNAGDIVTISKNVNDNDDNPVSSAAAKNAIDTAVAPINSDLTAIENVLTIEDLLECTRINSLKVDRSTKKIVTADISTIQIAYIFIPVDTSYYGLSIGSTDNINRDYIQTIGISEEFPANDISYIELDYQLFTNSGDRYTKDFSITDDMRGKYIIISTHTNVPITVKGKYLIDVAEIKDTIFYRDFYDEQQYTRINQLYMDGGTSKVLTSNTYQVAYWQIPADTIYDSIRVKSVDTRDHQYLQYIGITDVIPANDVPFVQKDYTRFRNTGDTIIKDIPITDEIKGKYLIVSTFRTISLDISGHRYADVLDEIENEMSELDERVTDLEEAQDVLSVAKIYNPKINFRKQELRVLDIGNSFTNGALGYINELMSDIYTVVKDESPSAAAIAAATQASSVITADSGGYTLSELASLMSSADKATVGELTLGNSVSFKYDVNENTVVWTFTKSQNALDLSNIAHCVAYRGGGSFKSWYDVYHDQDTETYSITKRFGSLSVNLSGTHDIGNGEQFRNVLTNNIWDIIIIHQASVYSDKYSQWEGNGNGGYLKELIRIIRTKQPQASIGYLFTHSSGSGDIDEFYANIAESVKFISSNYDIDWIIPYGTAIQNVRQSVINTSEHNLTSDNKHLARGLGHYVATCAYYQSLIAPRYGVSVYGNPYTHKVTDAEKSDAGSYMSDFIDVTPENVATAQMAVVLACNDMYNVNNPDGVIL